MRSRKPFLIFWPQYFDAKRSRTNGRRLPKKFSIEKVTLEDIAKAARNLGYKTEIEKNYKYPKTWWEDSGRVLIDSKGKKKSKVILEVAKEMRKSHTKS
jgi:signal recognition particle subunit SRP19